MTAPDQAPTEPTLANLQAIARRAWPTPRAGEDPPTVHDLVTCLANVAENRLARIRELERHIENLCRLREPRQ